MESKRSYFSLDDAVVYLNCAYKAPLLKAAESAVHEALVRERNPFRITVDDFFDDSNEIKKYFSELIGAHQNEISIIPSTSYGFANALNNISAHSGSNAVTIKDEFPSGYFAVSRWCEENNAELRIASPQMEGARIGRSWNTEILNQINENTSLVLISAVHWMNGVKFDLIEIGRKCKEVGAAFIVDGTQAVGALSINVRECHIDALICASYKWLYGPYSCGVAYYGERFLDGKPIEDSWMNRNNSREFSQLTNYDPTYAPGAARYSVGESSNFLLLPMLKEGLRQINEWGIDYIRAYCKDLADPLFLYLNDIGAGLEEEEFMCYHLFSLRLPDYLDGEELKEKFAERNIFISIRGEFIRVSVNVFNTERDIDELIAAIEEVRVKSSAQLQS